MNLLAWLNEQTEYPKIYWRNPSETTAFAAVGQSNASDVSYAWRLFSPTKAAHWADFPFSMEFHPRLIQTSTKPSSLSLNDSFSASFKRFTPDANEWSPLVEKAISQIGSGGFDKCVLARETLFNLETPTNLWPLVAELERNSLTTYVICIQPTPRSAFITLTPEKLFSRSKDVLETEALASTRKKNSLKSFQTSKYSKDQREFRLVEDSIREALEFLVSEPIVFSPQTIKETSHLQHLYSTLQVRLKENPIDFELLELLHPTAALLGYPKDKAWQFLKKNEPFDRGLYGAPIGRITPEGSTWVVGIRSCLLFESTARLYSGAGIVAGSHPDQEWEELNQKLHGFKDLIELGSHI